MNTAFWCTKWKSGKSPYIQKMKGNKNPRDFKAREGWVDTAILSMLAHNSPIRGIWENYSPLSELDLNDANYKLGLSRTHPSRNIVPPCMTLCYDLLASVYLFSYSL